MMRVLFTQDSEVKGLLCGASPGSEPSLLFRNYLLLLELDPVQDGFRHAFTWVNDEADDSVVLAEQKVALLRSMIISG